MKAVCRYLAALMAALLLASAAAAGLAAFMTTGVFLREVSGTTALTAQQQARIDAAAEALTETWGLSADTLRSWTDGAAEKQAAVMAAWWQELWHSPEADGYMPAFLDAAAERELIAAIMQDEGFRALTAESQRRAIARDEIAYALDEAVCGAVTPLRRSIVDAAVSVAAERLDLPLIRRMVLLSAAVLAVIGLALLVPAHRLAGSALLTAGSLMALCAVPVWLLDIPGMLAQLSEIAAMQGRNALAVLGILWLGAAAALMALGTVIICVKRAIRGSKC